MTDFDRWWRGGEAADIAERLEIDFLGEDEQEAVRRFVLAAWQAAQPKWQPINTAPKGQRILVVSEKNSSPFCVKYIMPKTLEANTDYGCDWADFDNAEGVYWCPEGWYLHSDCGYCLIEYRQYTGAQLTHWMPLPEVPCG